MVAEMNSVACQWSHGQDPVDWGYEQFVELVPRDGVLPEQRVGLAKQDEDSFDAGGDGLLKAAGVGDIDVDVIVDIDSMWSRCWLPKGIQDTWVESIVEGVDESWFALPI